MYLTPMPDESFSVTRQPSIGLAPMRVMLTGMGGLPTVVLPMSKMMPPPVNKRSRNGRLGFGSSSSNCANDANGLVVNSRSNETRMMMRFMRQLNILSGLRM